MGISQVVKMGASLRNIIIEFWSRDSTFNRRLFVTSERFITKQLFENGNSSLIQASETESSTKSFEEWVLVFSLLPSS